MPFYLVALNSVNSDPKTFSESAIQDPENIRARFKRKYPPEILYEEGDKEKSKVFGRDELPHALQLARIGGRYSTADGFVKVNLVVVLGSLPISTPMSTQ